MPFEDREDAGRRLADSVAGAGERPDVVLALPRGGVVVGAEVARRLALPLGLVIARKIGHPRHAEYAIAAVAEDGFLAANESECRGLDPDWLRGEIEVQTAEAARRRESYLGSSPPFDPSGRQVLVVDDGLATGLTMLAAVGSLRQRGAARIVAAAPVSPSDTLAQVEAACDRAIAVWVPEPFLGAVGAYYRDFEQTTDQEVVAALRSLESKRAADDSGRYQ